MQLLARGDYTHSKYGRVQRMRHLSSRTSAAFMRTPPKSFIRAPHHWFSGCVCLINCYAGRSEMKQSMSAQWLSESSALSSRAVAGPAVRRVGGRINQAVIAQQPGSLMSHRFCPFQWGSREAAARLRLALRQRVAVGSSSSSCGSLWSVFWSGPSGSGCSHP